MRRKQLAILGLAMLVSVAGALAAQSKALESTGHVKSIDLKARTVAVDTGYATDTFKLETKAMIDQQSPHKTLTLDQVKVGDRVQVHYTMSGPERLASKLEVLPVSQAANTSKPAPAKKK